MDRRGRHHQNASRRQFLGLCSLGLAWGLGESTRAAAGLFETAPKLAWQSDLRAAHRLSVQKQKPLLIVFTAEWCTYCHKLMKELESHRETAAWVEQHFIPVALDFDKHPKAAEVLGVEKLPCSVVLSPQIELLARQEGFLKADKFRDAITAALSPQTAVQPAGGTAGPR